MEKTSPTRVPASDPQPAATEVERNAEPPVRPQAFNQELTLTLPAGEVAKVRYRVLRPHAEGGLGRVFVAHDVELGREVALKEIKFERYDDSDSRARFLREAETTGKLEHPGIVPVYGLGTYPDGRPFYAMRFIRGLSLKEAIDALHGLDAVQGLTQIRGPQPDLRRLLRRMIDVCHAINYAHSRGVLHRDLKPSNIMLGPYGETLVVDWGLAKASGESSVELALEATSSSVRKTTLPDSPVVPMANESAPTQLGSAVGTPAYMSPEQALGRVDLLTPASDVFSLGAMLFQIVTGQPPYQAGSVFEVLRLAQECKYPRPSARARRVPRPLESIILKAMHPAMPHRYASAAQLAHDLESFLADDPVEAHRATLLERTARWFRRHKAIAATAAAVVVVAMLAASVIAVVSVNYNRSLAAANSDLIVAKKAAEDKEQLAREAQAQAEIQRKRAEEGFTFIMSDLRGADKKMTVEEFLKQYLAKQIQRQRQKTPQAEPSGF